ncbi:biopolymer transporter ExbD [Aequoribacter fuscus]|jgi:biopolymer transport protein ExbD|uniref:ExbD/TolR family protein n=1 Tax=Aequoribacter fuscus TaxID=2518989 RepID=UPI0002DF971C|nr:biopolymer transporter ExbD [Aequoribacter fuscus]QHJ89016.1 biopolymer transporter ExbD [Aequoribacter fuscus]
MRKLAKQKEEDGAEIDLTPMLDVVFIMLIFFIVVASFIKEAGIEVNRPDNSKSDPSDATSILVNIRSDNQIWMENRRVDVRSVRANIQRLLASDPEQAVTIKVEKGARANAVVNVADAAREAGAGSVNWASGGGKK